VAAGVNARRHQTQRPINLAAIGQNG
jgi:hypothetical protein